MEPTTERDATLLDTVQIANVLAVHIASATNGGTIFARGPEVYTGAGTALAISALLETLDNESDRLIRVTVEWEHTTKNGNWYSPTVKFLGS